MPSCQWAVFQFSAYRHINIHLIACPYQRTTKLQKSPYVHAGVRVEFNVLSFIQWLMYLSLGALVVADVYIAIVLCYLLYKARTGFNKG